MPQPIKNATPTPDSAAVAPPLNASNATAAKLLEQALYDLGLPEDVQQQEVGQSAS